jgi:Ca-activated chloride channel family protein
VTEFTVKNWDQLNWIWLLAALMLVLLAAGLRARRQSANFATPNRLAAILPEGNQGQPWLRQIGTLLAMACCVLALLDIRWGKTTREVPQRGLEIVFAMDVSRSMLAQDVTPNRLERAKQDIRDLMAAMAGNRIGLVAFAGEAVRILPLTTHYEDFKQNLAMVTPLDVRRGGTNLGEALITAADSFSQNNRDHKVIVLVTDGEDHESNPIAVASQLHREQGIRVFAIGLGDLQTGSLIPDTFVTRSGRSADNFLRHNGELIRSRLDGKILEGITRAAGGVFIPAGTRQVDLEGFYRRHLQPLGQTEFDLASIDVLIPRYPVFLALGLAFLVLETLLTGRPRGLSSTVPTASLAPAAAAKRSNPIAVSLGLILALFLWELPPCPAGLQSVLPIPSSLPPDDAKENYSATGTADEDLDQQILTLEENLRRQFDPRLAYNLGLLYAHKQDWERASDRFSAAAGSEQKELASQARYNLGNLEYNQALSLRQENSATAIERLNRAIGHYRAALRLNQQDLDARINTELAVRLRQSLLAQQPLAEETSGQRHSESADQNQNNDSEGASGSDPAQPQERSETGDPESQDPQTGDSGAEQQKQGADRSNQQGADSDSISGESSDQQGRQDRTAKTGNQSDQRVDDPGPSTDDATDRNGSQDRGTRLEQSPPGESPPAAGDSRNEREEGIEDGKDSASESAAETTERSPDPRAGLPTDSKGDPADDSSKNSSKNSSTDSDMEGDLGGLQQAPVTGTDRPTSGEMTSTSKMTEVEAAKMLQAVRDRELMRRLQQLRRQEARRIPVDRDW